MFLGKPDVKKEGTNELTPEVIESAAMEIIASANEILDMYEIDGEVLTLGLGLIPKEKKGKNKGQRFDTSFGDNEDYNISVNYSRVVKESQKKR